MRTYILIGVLFYVIMALRYFKSFDKASPLEVLKGLVWGIAFWPAALAYHVYKAK